MQLVTRSLVGIALCIVSTLLGVSMLEIGVRVFLPQQLILLRPDVFVPVDIVGYKKQGNLNTTINFGEGDVTLMTDANGYRVGSMANKIPALRILALGDSFLEALQVNYEQTMVARLEDELSQATGCPVGITNTGVGSYRPSHYLLTARHELRQKRYNLTIVFVYVGNDLESQRIDHFLPRQPTLRHYFRLPRHLRYREFVDAFLYPMNDFLEERSQLFILFKDRTRVLLARLGLTARYFASGLLRSKAAAPIWTITAETLAAIKSESEQFSVPTIFVLIPTSYQVDEKGFEAYLRSFNIDRSSVDLEQPQRILKREMEARGLAVFDSLPELKQAQLTGATPYGKIDTHFSPLGHQVMANYLFPHVHSILKASCSSSSSR